MLQISNRQPKTDKHVAQLDRGGWTLTSDQIEARVRLMEARMRIEALEFKLSPEVVARV
jgi:hypothetical protein